MSEKKKSISITTCEFRVSFPHVFEANEYNGKTAYEVTALFDKERIRTDSAYKAEFQKLVTAVNDAAASVGLVDFDWKSKIKDADADEKKAKLAGYPGHLFMKASTNEKQKPGVVDRYRNSILSSSVGPDGFYGGCYARASITITTYDNKYGKGVSIYLNHIQKLRDGEPFGSKVSVESAFDDLGDDLGSDTGSADAAIDDLLA